jgi:hypothetical protein
MSSFSLKNFLLLQNRNRMSILFLFYSSIFLGLPAGAEEEVYRRQGNSDWVGQNRPRSVRYAKQASGNRNETKKTTTIKVVFGFHNLARIQNKMFIIHFYEAELVFIKKNYDVLPIL